MGDVSCGPILAHAYLNLTGSLSLTRERAISIREHQRMASQTATTSLVSIDGQSVNIGSMPMLVRAVMSALREAESFSVLTLNLDHLVKRRQDERFREAYARARFVSADGAPIVWLARRLGVRLERTTGADLVLPLLREAAAMGMPVGFFGASDETLSRLREVLARLVPGLDIRFAEAPPMGFEPLSPKAVGAAARLYVSGVRLCFVALGAPKQEIFADRAMQAHAGIGFVCIGAALDFLAGTQKRAPGLFQRLGLEWFWRLTHEPRRLTRRYGACLALLADLYRQTRRQGRVQPS
jgi:exopolysaccharide biosynthesis WecB/TagA/CpsF family protein